LCEVLAPNYRVRHAADPGACLNAFRRRRYDVSFIHLDWLSAPGDEPLGDRIRDGLRRFLELQPGSDIIACGEAGAANAAVAAVRGGAVDFLACPVSPADVHAVLANLERDSRARVGLDRVHDEFRRVAPADHAGARSAAMREAYRKARLVAQTRTTVLITGETGTGKGVTARLIHRLSNRRDQQFVEVHCGAIPDNLVESELFGHERGAFTGAYSRSLGKFEVADGGTIFLDEVGTLSIPAQIKLLQVLQERTFRRVGGHESIAVDVRIIAATNIDLRELCERGEFRRDLYYRLNVFPIDIPPLRERPEDVPPLVDTFIQRLNRQNMDTIRGVDSEVMEALTKYTWPGNVRELENLIERAFILETGDVLTADSFPRDVLEDECGAEDQAHIDTRVTLAEARETAREAFERRYLDAQLRRCAGRIDRTAAACGITPRQLHKLLTRYEMRKETYKRSGGSPRSENPGGSPG
ncbi:MAG TPA: sigma-54 dependent transcriptional regulator, partial [Longimicrobiales bacterium]|nr:sigma-54 dependent transcriptional regulator [Longimicrobiales bacterium]